MKTGGVTRSQVHGVRGVVDSGVLITFEEATRTMREEAVRAGARARRPSCGLTDKGKALPWETKERVALR